MELLSAELILLFVFCFAFFLALHLRSTTDKPPFEMTAETFNRKLRAVMN